VILIAVLEKVVGMRSHFLTGEKIAAMLANCCKNATVFRKDFTVWVVLEK
jgi:hypothetical protein